MNNQRVGVPKRPRRTPAPRPRADRRVARTTRALGAALVELLLERHFDAITVQDVLDRAGVGRSTFYAHFRNKRDLLLSDYERVLGVFEARLNADTMHPPRVVPVKEFLQHLDDVRHLVRALRASGEMELLLELGTAHFARMIERRLALLPAPESCASPMPTALAARFCAGALMEMLEWWLDRDVRPTPEQMDEIYHELVWRALRRPTPVRCAGGERGG
jgi:AcrR family transcriptional regulator